MNTSTKTTTPSPYNNSPIFVPQIIPVAQEQADFLPWTQNQVKYKRNLKENLKPIFFKFQVVYTSLSQLLIQKLLPLKIYTS